MNFWRNAPTEFESGESTLLIDRRQHVRSAPIIDGTQLWIDGDCRVSVDLLDESDVGIGVLLADDVPFEFGPEVFVDISGRRRTASVAHITPTETGYRIGLLWTNAPSPNR